MPSASAIKALIVDDQLTMRTLIRASLQGIGVGEVDEAFDGQNALEVLKSKTPNLVISDFNMPNLDGLSLLKAMRGAEATRSTAFIMITGRADKDLVQRAAQFGANNYIVKPFNQQTLKDKLEEVFGALT